MKIVHEKSKCIGCGSCAAVCPRLFELTEEGKAHLKGAEIDTQTEKEELEVTEADCAKEAVEVCPVKCIRILNEK